MGEGTELHERQAWRVRARSKCDRRRRRGRPHLPQIFRRRPHRRRRLCHREPLRRAQDPRPDQHRQGHDPRLPRRQPVPRPGNCGILPRGGGEHHPSVHSQRHENGRVRRHQGVRHRGDGVVEEGREDELRFCVRCRILHDGDGGAGGHAQDEADEPADGREALRWLPGLREEDRAGGRSFESVEGVHPYLGEVRSPGHAAVIVDRGYLQSDGIQGYLSGVFGEAKTIALVLKDRMGWGQRF
mmetsp:Transcript_13917/g.30215  ORF Transcript_13917/g.30215 Transcript_13917/m.30215 type:complete len:242 (+) Transcript_13917:407-1132(+)